MGLAQRNPLPLNFLTIWKRVIGEWWMVGVMGGPWGRCYGREMRFGERRQSVYAGVRRPPLFVLYMYLYGLTVRLRAITFFTIVSVCD